AEPHARKVAIIDVPSALKALKDQIQLEWSDADAVIGDRQMRLPVFLPGAHSDLATVRAVLDRIIEELIDELPDPGAIEQSRNRPCRVHADGVQRGDGLLASFT